MIATGLLIAAGSAAMSLAVGLIKTSSASQKSSVAAGEITVIIHQGRQTIQKSGSINSNQVPSLLNMIDAEPVPSSTDRAAST